MIRLATLTDVPILVSLGALFHSRTALDKILPYNGECIRQLLTCSIEAESSIVLVLEDKGEVVGAIVGTMIPLYWNFTLMAGQQIAWFVRPTRRHGLAALGLLDAFEKWAFEEQGASVVFSGAKNDDNAAAMDKLLTRRGYFNLESLHLKTRGY